CKVAARSNRSRRATPARMRAADLPDHTPCPGGEGLLQGCPPLLSRAAANPLQASALAVAPFSRPCIGRQACVWVHVGARKDTPLAADRIERIEPRQQEHGGNDRDGGGTGGGGRGHRLWTSGS